MGTLILGGSGTLVNVEIRQIGFDTWAGIAFTDDGQKALTAVSFSEAAVKKILRRKELKWLKSIKQK
jgi:hypothetical protein